jgi:defect-in-organelle-trafficking protein DotA
MRRFFAFLALIIFPTLSWAQAASTFSPLNLSPPNSDLSFNYLSNIFGVVDGVLSGTGSQILGSLFGVFNSAVLVLGGIVILYTLFVSTLSTAHEGEVLGKRWSSIWIPLRSVAGIALLIPKASGYSFVQIFMMWVAVQGIGAADSIWGASLDYLTRGGVIIQQNMTAGSPQMTAMIDNSANLLRSLTCTYMLQKQFELYQQANGGTAPPNFYQGILAKFTSTSGSMTIPFPASGYKNTDGVCGNVSWSTVKLPTFMTDNQNNPKQQYVSIAKSIEQSRTLAVQSMITTLYPTAIVIVSNFLTPAPPAGTGPSPLGQIIPGSSPELWGSGSVTAPGAFLVPGSILSDASATYYGMMAPTLNLLNNSVNSSNDWMNEAREKGWVLAGKYYFSLVALNDSVKSFTENSAPRFLAPSDSLNTNPYVYGQLGGSNSPYVINLNTLVNSPSSNNTTVGADSPFITDAGSFGGSLKYGSLDIKSAYDSKSRANKALAIFFNGLDDVKGGFYNLMNAQETNTNPVLGLASLGSAIVNLCIMTFIYFALAILAIGLALGLAFGFAVAAAVVGFAVAIMGLITPILITLIVAGLVMCLYIPIIPFIIFTFGVIGWFIAVIEAIIAAPLVALGIAHPEGQEILGKAEPAVILLVNVFLRPTFMIFGLLVGMQLCYVSIWLLNQGFMDAYKDSAGRAATGWTDLFVPIGGIILYVIIVQQIVQKSFSLIHIIPDEVLKWIGGNIRGMGGEAEAAQAVGGKFQGAAQQMGETTGALGKSAVSGAAMLGTAGQGGGDGGSPGAGGSPKSDGGGDSSAQASEGAKMAATGGAA